ncbi:hypothetical protein B9G55_01270 [Saccharibacillus sp. O16]|nr:hypothetical protein B9G55_01270 [Saccharibacillus sp. O16]
MAIAIKTPATLAEALRLAADLAARNEELERQLTELRLNGEYPEVLRPADMTRLLRIGKSSVNEMTNDPNFPVLNQNRKKGEAVMVLKSDLYAWLKNGRRAIR